MIRHIAAPDRAGIAPLFGHHRHLRVLVDAVLQGYCGTATANAGDEAEVAQLAAGVFTFFGGDPAQPSARTLVERMSGERIIAGAEGDWRDVILRVHGERAGTERRLSFSPANLDLAHLRTLTAHLPDRFQIERVSADLAHRICAEVHPDLLLPEVFASPLDFFARGVGFCALADGRMVCGATSAFVCEGAIEIQINTIKAYRGLGLATAVGAALLVHCLEHGIEPHWDAGVPDSERVAEKLGYVPNSAYEWLVLHE
jgi:GNAT superfamily N-acetyltransferase